MPDHTRSDQTVAGFPSEAHAAHIGLTLLDQANSSLKRCTRPAPRDSIYRTAANLRIAQGLVERIEDILAEYAADNEPSLITYQLRNGLDATKATLAQAELAIRTDDLHPGTTDWYHQAETALADNQLILAIAAAVTTPAVSEVNREARTIVAEEIWLTSLRQREPAPPPSFVSSGEQTIEMMALREEAEQAASRTATLSAEIVRRYDESLTLQISPRLKDKPQAAIEAARVTASPSSMLFAVLIDEEHAADVEAAETELNAAYLENREPRNLEPLKSIERWVTPFVIFAHNGRKIAKHVAEPYPRGYPKHLAAAHMAAALDMIASMAQDNQPPLPGANMTAAMMRDMAKASDLAIHDIGPDDVNNLLQSMESIGIPKGGADHRPEGPVQLGQGHLRHVRHPERSLALAPPGQHRRRKAHTPRGHRGEHGRPRPPGPRQHTGLQTLGTGYPLHPYSGHQPRKTRHAGTPRRNIGRGHRPHNRQPLSQAPTESTCRPPATTYTTALPGR